MRFALKKVLVVDDEQDILELWLDYFKGMNQIIEVHTAIDGVDAYKCWEANGNYDLIITDHRMPLMTGWEFIKKLRSTKEGKDVPVFFFTAYLPDLQKLEELDNVLLFDKPMITSRMSNALKIHLLKAA